MHQSLRKINRQEYPCYVPILWATFYGMRCSEAIALQWSSVDFNRHPDDHAMEESADCIEGLLAPKMEEANG